MLNDLIEVCGTTDSIQVDSIFNVNLDGNDVGAFYLHRGNSINLESVIDSSFNGLFPYSLSIQLDTIYYVSYVVGDSINAFPDINDPCFDVAVGQPVVWRSIPVPNAGDDFTSCENDILLNATTCSG